MIDPSLIISGLAGGMLAVAGGGTLTVPRCWRLRLGFAYAKYSSRELLIATLIMLAVGYVFCQPVMAGMTYFSFPKMGVAVGCFGVVLATLPVFRLTLPCPYGNYRASLRNEGSGTVSLHLNHRIDADEQQLRMAYRDIGHLVGDRFQELSVFGVRQLAIRSYLLAQNAPSGQNYQCRKVRMKYLGKAISVAMPNATIELLPLGRSNWPNSLYLRLRMTKINAQFPWRKGVRLPAAGMVVAI